MASIVYLVMQFMYHLFIDSSWFTDVTLVLPKLTLQAQLNSFPEDRHLRSKNNDILRGKINERLF